MQAALSPTTGLAGGRLYVLVHPHPRLAMLEITAQLAAAPGAGGLRVLDAGNWFNAYGVAERLRQLVDRSAAPSILPYLQRIQVARAFTCFQVAALLEQAAAQTGPQAGPALVLDLLGAFHDENVNYAERLRLLRGCLPALLRLRRGGPVLACARPGDPTLTGLLLQAADARLEIDPGDSSNPGVPSPGGPSSAVLGATSAVLGASPSGPRQLSFLED